MSAEKSFDPVTVENLAVMRVKVESKHFKEMFNIETLPLSDSWLEFELKGARAAYGNGIRRVLTDELQWRALNFDGLISANTDPTSDPMMFDQIVRSKITQIALRPQLEESTIKNVRFGLDVTNNTSTMRSIYSGDLHVSKGELRFPIFNPTFIIAKIQPGTSLKIDDIYISRGVGRENAIYQVGALSRIAPLDIPRYPKSETHTADGAHRDESGFTVSTLVAVPKHFTVRVKIAATSDDPNIVRSIAVDACISIKERLNKAAAFLERLIGSGKAAGNVAENSISYQEGRQTSGEVQAVLHLEGESDTIGNLLKTGLYECHPEILFNDYTCITHERKVSWIVRISSGSVAEYMVRGIHRTIQVYDQIENGISKCKLEKKQWKSSMLL